MAGSAPTLPAEDRATDLIGSALRRQKRGLTVLLSTALQNAPSDTEHLWPFVRQRRT